MRRYGHWGVTMALSLPFIAGLSVFHAALVVGMMLLTTLLPNAQFIRRFITRRGFTHTIWFAGIVAVVIGASAYSFLQLVETGLVELGGINPGILQPRHTSIVIGGGACLGIISHVVADAIPTDGGKPAVCPFAPIMGFRVRFGIISPGHPIANEALFQAMLVIFALVCGIRVLLL